MKNNQRKKPQKIEERIQLTLLDEDALRFREYKDKEFLRTNADAARKIILERLREATNAN